MNGIAAYGANLVPLGGTFLNFLSYASGAIRLSALSKFRVVWIATHDTVCLGFSLWYQFGFINRYSDCSR